MQLGCVKSGRDTGTPANDVGTSFAEAQGKQRSKPLFGMARALFHRGTVQLHMQARSLMMVFSRITVSMTSGREAHSLEASSQPGDWALAVCHRKLCGSTTASRSFKKRWPHVLPYLESWTCRRVHSDSSQWLLLVPHHTFLAWSSSYA